MANGGGRQPARPTEPSQGGGVVTGCKDALGGGVGTVEEAEPHGDDHGEELQEVVGG